LYLRHSGLRESPPIRIDLGFASELHVRFHPVEEMPERAREGGRELSRPHSLVARDPGARVHHQSRVSIFQVRESLPTASGLCECSVAIVTLSLR
jgi:hypothetical protein